MNPLKAAWKRGEVIEWRVRGSENPWMLEPSEWDEQLYEYREYHPMLAPPRELSDAQQRAVELGKSLIENRRAMDQAAIAAETFKAPVKRKWWQRVRASRVAFAVAMLLWLAAMTWMMLR